jgi:hypothetical protein
MGEIRVVLLAFFTLVTARMLGEQPSCFGNILTDCGHGLIIIIPFILSTYFVDSLLQTLETSKDLKEKILNTIFCIPYIIFSLFVIREFFLSVSIVTIEYILALETIYAAIIYSIIYLLNNQKITRRLNTIFMVSFILTVLVFYLI